MFLSNISRVVSRPTDIGSIIFPVGTVIPYSGATPSVFGWSQWTSVTDHCLFSTTSLTQATTPASGGPSFSVSYGSSTNASHSVLGSSYNHYSLGSTGSSSVFTFIGQDGNHTHSGGTLNSEVYSNLSPRRAQFNFLVATAPQKFLPANALVFSSKNNNELGSLFSQTATTYIAPQPNGAGSVSTGTLSETRSVGSGSAGSHRHTSGPFSSVIRSGNFSTSIFQPQFGGAHTHSSSLQYNQTIFGETIILRLYNTLSQLPPTDDVIVGYVGDITRLEAPWYLCDGSNATVDLRNKFIAVNNNLEVEEVLNTNLTRNPLTTNWSSTHGHQGNFLTSGVIASASFGHTSAEWSHTHAISDTYNDTPRIAARANLYFIQYKSPDFVSYVIRPGALVVNEGQSVSFDISTSNITNGTTLYWTIVSESGNVNADDFTDNAISGSFVVNNNAATIVRTLRNDFTIEGTESFRLQLRTNSISGTVVAESKSITINDTSIPTYTVTPGVTSLGEGGQVTFTVITQGVPNGTTLYWTTQTLNGIINADDFNDGLLSGSFTINDNTASIVRVAREDFTTEGSESFALQIRTESTSGTIRATSATVTINDTSQNITVTPNVTSVNEGGSVTFTITTTGVNTNATLFWTTETVSGAVNANDFTDGLTSGSFTFTNGTASIVRTLTNDFTLEGTESFRLQIRTGSTSGTVRATSSTVTVNDTSVPTYAVASSASSINEGESVTFTVTTQGVPNDTTLYWTTLSVSGTINADDFTDGLTSGSFTINNNTASITRTLRNDFTTEGNEIFALQIRTGSTSGTVRASTSVTVIDTSVPTYAVTPNVTSVDEGGSVTFTVTTQGVPSGTILYWTTQTISGFINNSDFTDNVTSGSFTINNNTATIVRGIRADTSTEGSESFAIQIRTGSTSGTLRATSSTVTINDTSRTPTYAVTPNVTSVNEGGSVTFTVTTTDVPDNTTLYWSTQQISGTINTNDFTDNVTSGSFTITNSTASITRTLRNDFTTEGSESFAVQIRTDSISGTVRATSATVTINDTSVEIYSITPNVTSVDEGGSVTFTVTTQGVPSGTTLYWTTQTISGTINNSDFTSGTSSGSFTINNNTGSIVRAIREDFTTEGTESFRLLVRTVSTSGTVVATSATVTINDTSRTPTVVPNITSVTEGGSVTFTVTTVNVPNGTVLWWTTQSVSGSVNTADFTDNIVSSSFSINNNTATIVRGIRIDATDSGESFALQIRTGSTSGPIIATSATVTINDATVTVTPNTTSVNEGDSVTFTISTNLANGTTLFWSTNAVSGTVNASDFTDNVLSGSFTVNNGAATIVRGIRADASTEGSESFQLQIRSESAGGPLLATSSTVTINDTSQTPPGQILFTTSATGYGTRTSNSWTVPAGVFSISMVCIGGGGGGRSFTNSIVGGGGGGGALDFRNNFSVTPGQVITVFVGNGGQGLQTDSTNANKSGDGGVTEVVISNTVVCRGDSGKGAFGTNTSTTGGFGGVRNQGTSNAASGGRGGFANSGATAAALGGGGGAGGYTGSSATGGAGGYRVSTTNLSNAIAGAGGSGGGGGYKTWIVSDSLAGTGGGTGVLGQGSNGTAGANATASNATAAGSGGAGSGGSGKLYGGGGPGGFNLNSTILNAGTLNGSPGAVRIMWPGNLRQYPSTRTADE